MIISLAVLTDAVGTIFAHVSLHVAVQTGNHFCQLSFEAEHGLELTSALSQISKKAQLFTMFCAEGLIMDLKIALPVVWRFGLPFRHQIVFQHDEVEWIMVWASICTAVQLEFGLPAVVMLNAIAGDHDGLSMGSRVGLYRGRSSYILEIVIRIGISRRSNVHQS
jgi:hypothetical protein